MCNTVCDSAPSVCCLNVVYTRRVTPCMCVCVCAVPQKTSMYAHLKQEASSLAVHCCGVNLDHIECLHHHDIVIHKLVPIA